MFLVPDRGHSRIDRRRLHSNHALRKADPLPHGAEEKEKGPLGTYGKNSINRESIRATGFNLGEKLLPNRQKLLYIVIISLLYGTILNDLIPRISMEINKTETNKVIKRFRNIFI